MQGNLDQEAPKIEFPCDYVIKVMGVSAPEFREFVIETVRLHAPGVEESRVTVNASRDGRYASVSIWFEATGVEQLQALHQSLRESDQVKMVL